MALTAQLMANMDDGYLVSALHAEIDPLTSTDAERELLARVERLLDERADTSPLTDLMAEYDLDEDATPDLKALLESHPSSLKTMAEMLALLNDEDIHETEQLKALIARANEFRAIANDAGDVLTRLSQLITTAQE